MQAHQASFPCVLVVSRRPSGQPAKDLRAHLVPVKLKQRDKLRDILHEVETENKQLQKCVVARRQRLASVERQAAAGSESVSKVKQTDLLALLLY